MNPRTAMINALCDAWDREDLNDMGHMATAIIEALPHDVVPIVAAALAEAGWINRDADAEVEA